MGVVMSDVFQGLEDFEIETEIEDIDTILAADLGDSLVVSGKEVSCDLPHWKVDRAEFVQIISIAKSFPIKTTTLVFGLKLEPGSDGSNYLHIHYDNRDSTIEARIPIHNKDCYLTDRVYFINADNLLKLIQQYPDFVFAFDENAQIYFFSNFSQVKLDVHNLNWDSMVKPIPEAQLRFIQFPLRREHVLVFKNLFGSALKQSDNVLLIDSEHVEAFFTLYLYKLNRSTPDLDFNFVLRKIDLYPLLELYSLGGEVLFAVHDGVVYFKWVNGFLYFKQKLYAEKDFMYPKTFSSGATTGEFQLDIALAKKALTLSRDFKLPSVTFFGESGKIYCSPNRDNYKFEVGTGDLSEDGFTLVCEALLKLISTISDKEVSCHMTVTDTGIELVVNNPQSPVEISLSRISASQQKRTETIERKQAQRQKQIDNLAAKGEVRDTQRDPEGRSFAEVAGIDLDI